MCFGGRFVSRCFDRESEASETPRNALRKMFLVDHPEDLGKGRDADKYSWEARRFFQMSYMVTGVCLFVYFFSAEKIPSHVDFSSPKFDEMALVMWLLCSCMIFSRLMFSP